jgi:hypothetical protein
MDATIFLPPYRKCVTGRLKLGNLSSQTNLWSAGIAFMQKMRKLHLILKIAQLN